MTNLENPSNTTSLEEPKKVGFVSLGCPKALVDSERILTKLQLDGYKISPNYNDADAISENGRVIVTGCMGKGADAEAIQKAHPSVLSVSGPADYDNVLNAVHQFVPPTAAEHNPLIDLIPPQGVKLTPKHYAYLKISEGCNHRCTFCIMRGSASY
jgi:ribosomal protein S12 methylthiotransferase